MGLHEDHYHHRRLTQLGANQCGRHELSAFLACLLVAPAFSASAAPDEELLGKAKGYPVGNRANWFFDEGLRVGSFSHLDEILLYYTLSKAQSPLPLAAAPGEAEFGYRFENQAWTIEDFLAPSASPVCSSSRTVPSCSSSTSMIANRQTASFRIRWPSPSSVSA